MTLTLCRKGDAIPDWQFETFRGVLSAHELEMQGLHLQFLPTLARGQALVYF